MNTFTLDWSGCFPASWVLSDMQYVSKITTFTMNNRGPQWESMFSCHPFSVCYFSQDLTGGAFEANLDSLKLKEGQDFYFFSWHWIFQFNLKSSCSYHGINIVIGCEKQTNHKSLYFSDAIRDTDSHNWTIMRIIMEINSSSISAKWFLEKYFDIIAG